jgi:hypothetical protein
MSPGAFSSWMIERAQSAGRTAFRLYVPGDAYVSGVEALTLAALATRATFSPTGAGRMLRREQIGLDGMRVVRRPGSRSLQALGCIACA